MSRIVRVGTRGSALALEQTRRIVDWLRPVAPDTEFQVVEIVTHGDRHRATPIAAMGERVESGIFNTALEQALLSGEVDLATCSFKDVESALAEGLVARTVGPREDPRDVLVSRHQTGLAGLPHGAVLATSSPRRTSQLGAVRPDLRFEPLRGNITTRVERDAARFDGVVLAAAGLLRLGLDAHVSEFFDPDVLLPAPAQGALGCEYRADRPELAELVEAISRPATERTVRAEKALLVALSGGCYAPIGALAEERDGDLWLRGRVVSLDGRERAEGSAVGPAEQWPATVERLAADLERQGAVALVAAARAAFTAGAAGAEEEGP